jgi:hypothetical protein
VELVLEALAGGGRHRRLEEALVAAVRADERGLERLRAALGDDARAGAALTALVALGPRARLSEPALRALAGDEARPRELRLRAAEALWDVAAAASPAVALHEDALDAADVVERRQAAVALRRYGPAARPALERLAALAADPGQDEALRLQCAATLQAMGPAAKPALPALLRALEHPEASVRRGALHAVAAIDRADPEVRAALERVAREGAAEDREVARELLGTR